jgi:hypothetical protein
MNWDMIINVGMFLVGCTAIIVATAQLCFGDFEEDDDDWDDLPEHEKW